MTKHPLCTNCSRQLRSKDIKERCHITDGEKSTFFHDLPEGPSICNACDSEFRHKAVEPQTKSKRTQFNAVKTIKFYCIHFSFYCMRYFFYCIHFSFAFFTFSILWLNKISLMLKNSKIKKIDTMDILIEGTLDSMSKLR